MKPTVRCSLCRYQPKALRALTAARYGDAPFFCRWCRARFLELGQPDPAQAVMPFVERSEAS